MLGTVHVGHVMISVGHMTWPVHHVIALVDRLITLILLFLWLNRLIMWYFISWSCDIWSCDSISWSCDSISWSCDSVSWSCDSITRVTSDGVYVCVLILRCTISQWWFKRMTSNTSMWVTSGSVCAPTSVHNPSLDGIIVILAVYPFCPTTVIPDTNTRGRREGGG